MMGGKYGVLEVMFSGGGFYLGRSYEEDRIVEPGTRESGYYPTKEAVVKAVQQGLFLRDCPENRMGFERRDFKTKPGSFYKDETFRG